MTVRIIDRGANKVLRETSNRRRRNVDVGVLGSKASRPHQGDAGISVADVAEWAEFGMGQPQRSWLRAWVDANEDLINERIDNEMEAVLRGHRTADEALKRIGVWLQGECQLNIANFPDNGFAPNAPSTIRQKGSSVPLINSGQLRSSISHRVE